MSNKIKQIIGLGLIAGMRSMSAPALVSNHLQNHSSKRLRQTNLNFMQTGKASTIFNTLAALEMVADKLPLTPSRTEPGSLIGRGLSGALVGATLSYAQRREGVLGAGIGLVSALASTYFCFLIRKKLTERTVIPGFFWGVAEDILTIRSGQKLLKSKGFHNGSKHQGRTRR